MAFPSPGTRSTGTFAASSGTVTYPGTIAADDLLLFHMSCDGPGDNVSGWGGSSFSTDVLLNNGGSDNGAAVAFHKAVGDEDSTTFTLTLTSGEKCRWSIFPISGWETTLDPEISTNATGNSTTPDAGLVTASWGSDDNLFFWHVMMDNAPTVSAYPTSYTDNQFSNDVSNGGNSRLAIASRDLAADNDNPGTATLSAAEAWQCGVVVIAPTGAGGLTISPAGIASAEAFGSHTINVGAVTITPTGIASLEAFGSHQINQAIILDAQGIPSAEAFGSPQINQAIILDAQGIVSAEAFGSHVINVGGVAVIPTGIASAEAFGSHVISSADIISPAGIASLEAFGGHVINVGGVSILPAGIISGEAFGSHVITSASIISPAGIASLEAFGNVTIAPGTVVILPTGIASGEIFGTAVITGGDVTAVGDIVRILLRRR